ncbi:hypothetical protein AWB80_02871 [Caballeronia pedi]|uniref:Uncharacterized protein n=1 Tax=Caballeronia pedi TaxID=1777141 RepID=A0A158B083_9BURK|nr:hypothetical protein [Caballeronia pedi]SAK63482.1 hypothetical protein AWB80_02871 [Caballeronia pedi]
MNAFGRWLRKVTGDVAPIVSEIEIASLHPGDLLIFHLPEQLSPDQVERLRADLTTRLPRTVNCCLMVGEDVRVDIVRVVDPTTRPMQRPIGG